MTKTILLTLTLAILTGCALFDKGKDKLREEKDEWLEDHNFAEPDDTGPQLAPEELPFAWSDVEWCAGDQPVGGWAVTLGMVAMNVNGDLVTWSYAAGKTPDSLGWKQSNRISCNPNAVIGWVTQIDGAWYGAIGEWLPKGQQWQSRKLFQSDRGDDDDHDYKFRGKLKTFKPQRGHVFYAFVCGLNWKGLANVRERSNLVKVTL